jgi:predicted DNA-binding protein with PD1-like motif
MDDRAEPLHETDGLRTFALVLRHGDKVCETLLGFARERELSAASISAIGAFSSATLGFFDWERKDYARILVEEQVEVLSLTGDVSLAPDSTSQLHMHVVLGKRDGTAHGGHLLEAEVRPTLEVMVIETPPELRRRHDPESGLALIEPSTQ